MIYLDPSQLWNCLAQFHGVIYKDSSAESSCILRSFLFPPPAEAVVSRESSFVAPGIF